MQLQAPGLHGYADAKPSESIQKHEIPGLAVAVVFPWKPGLEMLEVPVGQYKDYKAGVKGAQARRLAEWLADQKEQGLLLTGFFQVGSQLAAANLGMAFLEELPETRVEAHYATFRLHFGNECLDLAQAVALEYYNTAINLGVLRAGLKLKPEDRTLFVAMDRFPGAGSGNAGAGQPLPKTQGAKFIDFVRRRSSTAIGIQRENASINLTTNLGTLDWWKSKSETEWREGKTHPHFTLPDWLVASALAESYPEEFTASFRNSKAGTNAVAGLSELYQSFKKYDLWSANGLVTALRPVVKRWAVPVDAREFIIARAKR